MTKPRAEPLAGFPPCVSTEENLGRRHVPLFSRLQGSKEVQNPDESTLPVRGQGSLQGGLDLRACGRRASRNEFQQLFGCMCSACFCIWPEIPEHAWSYASDYGFPGCRQQWTRGHRREYAGIWMDICKTHAEIGRTGCQHKLVALQGSVCC